MLTLFRRHAITLRFIIAERLGQPLRLDTLLSLRHYRDGNTPLPLLSLLTATSASLATIYYATPLLRRLYYAASRRVVTPYDDARDDDTLPMPLNAMMLTPYYADRHVTRLHWRCHCHVDTSLPPYDAGREVEE